MKIVKMTCRIVVTLMACVMGLGMPIATLAAEPTADNSNRIEVVVGPHETVEIDMEELLASGDAISTGVIYPGQTGRAYGYLDSYFGLYKTIHFSAIYCGNSGTVQCIFTNTDGYNDTASCSLSASNMNISKNIWGAHSGNYRLTVYNSSSGNCAVACYW